MKSERFRERSCYLQYHGQVNEFIALFTNGQVVYAHLIKWTNKWNKSIGRYEPPVRRAAFSRHPVSIGAMEGPAIDIDIHIHIHSRIHCLEYRRLSCTTWVECVRQKLLSPARPSCRRDPSSGPGSEPSARWRWLWDGWWFPRLRDERGPGLGRFANLINDFATPPQRSQNVSLRHPFPSESADSVSEPTWFRHYCMC